MAKLVIGTNKQTVVPAVVRDKSPIYYREYMVDSSNQMVSATTTPKLDFTGVKKIAISYCFYKWFDNNTQVTGDIDLADVEEVPVGAFQFAFQQSGITGFYFRKAKIVSDYSFTQAFYRNTNITNFYFNSESPITMNGGSCFYYAFAECSNLTSVDINNLAIISGSSAFEAVFQNCNLSNVDMSCLIDIMGSSAASKMFKGNVNLSNVNLKSLRQITQTGFQNAFEGCVSIQDLSFPALRYTSATCMNNMLSGVTGCTVHLPANMQSTMSSYGYIQNGFGGTNTTILWDLPNVCTLTGADSSSYERNPAKDTLSALSWRKWNTKDINVAYYTSTTADPQVGDTIYSDSACTTAVTTISSIA